MTREPDPRADYRIPADRRWRLGEFPWRDRPFPTAHARVIIDNDFAGDPDDLPHLVHHLLSPAVDVRAVVASHLPAFDRLYPYTDSAVGSEAVARDVFARMGCDSTEVIYRGASEPLADLATPQDSPAAQAIIAEAMRDDVDTPLYYAAGGGLTDLASAYLLEPRIAGRIILVWTGGPVHEGVGVESAGREDGLDYNTKIDLTAARVLFTAPALTIYQVPGEVSRQCAVTDLELRRMAATGPVGQYMYDEIAHLQTRLHTYGWDVGEVYVLGDQPLVLITALRHFFDPSQSPPTFVERPTPALDAEGRYQVVDGSRTMRIYTQVDTRLMFEDFFGKVEEFARWQATGQSR